MINHWLIEMKVGSAPERGLLLDETLAGRSAEEIYDRMTGDMRIDRKLATLAGRSASDMLDKPGARRRRDGFTDLDDFYRSALARGYELHCAQDRGLLPAGLVERSGRSRIRRSPGTWRSRSGSTNAFRRSRSTAPMRACRGGSRRRPTSRARTGRRSSSTGARTAWCSTRRARWTASCWESARRDRELQRGPRRDDGARRVLRRARLRRGLLRSKTSRRACASKAAAAHTQPGIDVLEAARDFPADGPILVITDGYCDAFKVRRDHAILMPAGPPPVRPTRPDLPDPLTSVRSQPALDVHKVSRPRLIIPYRIKYNKESSNYKWSGRLGSGTFAPP